MATTIESIQQLYIAYFSRPADVGGLNFWLDSLSKGATLADISEQFAASNEYKAEYGGKSPEATVAQVYQNLLNRIPDAGGLSFWADGLRNGTYTVDGIVEEIAKSALQNAEGDADRVAVDSKIDAAIAFTDYLKTNTPALIAYSTGSANGVAKTYIAGVTNPTNLATATAGLAATGETVVAAGNPGTNANLTTGVDTLVGGVGNDVFTGLVDGTDDTVTALDSIDGGNGNDTLTINSIGGTAVPTALTVKSVENVIVRGSAGVDVDTSTWTGVNSLKVTQGTTVDATAAGTTAIDVSGATGAIVTEGGAAVNVAAATDGQTVAIGGTTAATGTVTVNHTKLGTGSIAIDTEGAVNVTATGLKNTGGDVTIGASEAAGGAVAVTTTGVAYNPAAASALGGVSVTGGTTVTVTQNATSSDAKANDAEADVDNTGQEITQGDIAVTGGAKTTEVTVKQTAAATAKDGVAAVAAEAGEQTITFTAVTAGTAVTVGGLTFTASKALTAAQVAAAFANLGAEDSQGAGAAGNGIYSGTFATGTSFTTGAVVTSGTTVTVVASTDDPVDTDLGVTGATTGALSAATAEVDAVTGVMGVVAGKVTIDSGDGKIAKVSIDGYGAASTIVSDDLTSLSLAHSKADLAITNTKATTLALALDGVGSGATLSGGTYKTLNVTTANADSSLIATFASVEALTVGGTKAVTFAATSDLSGLQTVVVSGSAGLTIADALAGTVKSVNASATSGAVSVKIDNATTTYAGGSGADTLAFTTTSSTKGANLGAGDDSLTLLTGTTSLSGVLNGGDGTDTLVMVAADAAAASLSTTFETKIDSFEKLSLTGTASETVDLANLDDIKYVITSGATALVLDNLATGGTIEHTADATLVTANVVDADDNAADVLNVVVKGNANIAAGEVAAADVETFNVTVTDTKASDGISAHSLTVTGDALATVKVTGNADLTLTLGTGTDAVTLIDGSAMTGSLTADTGTGGGAKIVGGADGDNLTANGEGDTLQGGAGNDVLKVLADQVTLTGGAGADEFQVGHAVGNVNSYATITDLTAGDVLTFSAAIDFLAAKVTTGGTAVFQDLANLAIKNTDIGDLAWFQFDNNTYLVENVSDDTTAFQNGTDIIVKIVGNVDLSKASLSSTDHTLLFA